MVVQGVVLFVAVLLARVRSTALTPRPTEARCSTSKGLAKRYGGIRAVAEGNLQVGRGEMMGLVGPNGCGKSTMLNIVSGVVKPDGRTVVFDGEPLPLGAPARRRIAECCWSRRSLPLPPTTPCGRASSSAPSPGGPG